jgi:hypothetical protein
MLVQVLGFQFGCRVVHFSVSLEPYRVVNVIKLLPRDPDTELPIVALGIEDFGPRP